MEKYCRFNSGDTVIAIEVNGGGCPLQYGKKYKIRKDTRILSKEFLSEGEFIFLEGISGGWYPSRFKLDTGPLEEVLRKETGKPRRMLRI